MSAIKRALRRVRHKIARVVLGLEVCERRIKHFKRTMRSAGASRADKERAERYLRRWQKRQTWLRDKHIFLQTVLHRRLAKKRKWLKEHPPQPKTGAVIFDGKPCAAWIAEILTAARASGVWRGYMLSGVRTSSESVALCEAMCGAPSCPGRCGGTASNHNCDVCGDGEGAADVTDPAGLQRYCREHDLPLRGNGEVLSADLNHFSRAGN
jgi:hypothetical protein